MRNKMGIFSRLGYLNPYTGRYQWADIVIMDLKSDTVTVLSIVRQGRFTWNNVFTEKIEDILKHLRTPSPDHKDGRPLMKHKSFTGFNTPEHLEQYMNSQQVTTP